MEYDFEKVMSKHSDAELIKIVNGPPDDYQPAAFEAAQKEYARRNLSQSQIEIAKTEIEKEESDIIAMANRPLSAVLKALAFFFPGFIYLILVAAIKSEGQLRKAKELGRWTLYGFGFYLLIGILVIVSVMMTI
jgi:hypothetical protein